VLNSSTANKDRLQMFGMGGNNEKSHSSKDLLYPIYDLPNEATNPIMVQTKLHYDGFSPMMTRFNPDTLHHGNGIVKRKSCLEVLIDLPGRHYMSQA